MSGSRHKLMNAVRVKKESQVISNEEKKALMTFNQAEKVCLYHAVADRVVLAR